MAEWNPHIFCVAILSFTRTIQRTVKFNSINYGTIFCLLFTNFLSIPLINTSKIKILIKLTFYQINPLTFSSELINSKHIERSIVLSFFKDRTAPL